MVRSGLKFIWNIKEITGEHFYGLTWELFSKLHFAYQLFQQQTGFVWSLSQVFRKYPRKSLRQCHLFFDPLSANLTEWSNTLKQFVGCCRGIVWVCLTILWCWRLKGLVHLNNNLLDTLWFYLYKILPKNVKFSSTSKNYCKPYLAV